MTYLEFCMAGGGYLFSPFIYSVINLYQYGLMNIYFLYFGLSCKAILFVSLLKLFQLWALGTFPVAPMSFSHNPHQCGCGLVFFVCFLVFEQFFTFWNCKLQDVPDFSCVKIKILLYLS